MRSRVAVSALIIAVGFAGAWQGANGQGRGNAAVPDLQGTYWATVYYPTIPIVGGGAPPLNAEGRAAYDSNRAGLRDGSLEDQVRKWCLPDAVPRLLATPYPFQLFQVVPGQITFIHELVNQVRMVGLNVKLPTYDETQTNPNFAASWAGYTSGHYEGDTLVIRATGFNDQTFLDSSGLPHSDQLLTTERIRRIGNQLEDVVTIHDPGNTPATSRRALSTNAGTGCGCRIRVRRSASGHFRCQRHSRSTGGARAGTVPMSVELRPVMTDQHGRRAMSISKRFPVRMAAAFGLGLCAVFVVSQNDRASAQNSAPAPLMLPYGSGWSGGLGGRTAAPPESVPSAGLLQ